MNEINNLFELEIKNIDSIMRSHNINNCSINRELRSLVVHLGDMLESLLSFGWVDKVSYSRFTRLVDNRIIKLDNVYYCKERVIND